MVSVKTDGRGEEGVEKNKKKRSVQMRQQGRGSNSPQVSQRGVDAQCGCETGGSAVADLVVLKAGRVPEHTHTPADEQQAGG
jgi:hypothetical protein